MNVADYMNTHIVYLREGDHVSIARRPMLDFGITAVPILDEEHRPVGVVSLRDLADDRQSPPHVARDVRTIETTATLETAARRIATEEIHHLIVVDDHGAAVGVLSTLDVVRGLVGLPPKHPQSIRRFVAIASDDFESEYRSE